MGPLAGLRIIELGGIGPGPFCGMMLADMGADVVRIDRMDAVSTETTPNDPLLRSRTSIALDLRQPRAVEVVLRLADDAAALFEGFRPGVAERLGCGPEVCLRRNPKLVYGRITGWGQEGPLARTAGHDINYIALAGALHAIGPPGGKPVPPLNLVGDFGGGGMLLAFGLVCALLETQRSGQGQVVDAAMVDGTLAQMALSFGMLAADWFPLQTGASTLAGAAPFYDTYATADGRFVAIGALEAKFFTRLLELTGIPPEAFADAGFRGVSQPMNSAKWPQLRQRLEHAFRQKTRDQWGAIMAGTEVCFAPVLTLQEVHDHPHHRYRDAVIEVDGVWQNAPAPRFSRSRTARPTAAPEAGRDTAAVLKSCGYSPAAINELQQQGIVR